MSKILQRLLPLLLLFYFHPDSAGAQQGGRPLNLKLGDAVVTGFSGTVRSEPVQPGARNRAPNDFTFINPDGPSVRVVDVSRPGYVWDGRLFAAPKTFDVFAKDVGQVFGVALDDSERPNIYVAATSVFGLNIVVRGRDGKPERRKKGTPGAGWMKGQFGLDLQGGPGSIYKIDGRTGVPALFANVTLNGVPNPGPGLGNLAYDSAHKQLFVSDLHTGMIHRFALDGKELGAYDHGVAGLGAAKLAPVAFNPANRPNIASDRFDSEKPDSWGFAPAVRRVWGLAVHEGRLYYSVMSGPQIWSVGIERDGSFAADPRWEYDVPAQAGPLPVSDIAFSQKGAMILAQRALIAGAYDYSAFTRPGEPQVFRVWLKGPNDPPSPGRWKLTPEEYAIGYAGNNRNSNGGVALGYGYDQAGTSQPGSCEAALWTTGQNLRNNAALRGQLEPGGPLLVHGVQGSPSDMVRNANTPPATSYFVDYDDKFDDPRARGHMGSVRIFAQPCAPSASIVPVATVVPIATPIGCIGPNCRNACTPTCICPPGTVLQGKECVKTDACPPPMIPGPVLGQCICPPGTVLVGKECVPRTRSDLTCPPPFIPGPTPGSCVCPPGTVQQGHTCVPLPHECLPPLVLDPVTHTCVCPPGTVQQGRLCVPQICPPPMVPGPCECPEGTVQVDGQCVKGTPIDLTIGKENTPAGGSGTWFNMWVTNVGPAITYQAGELTVKDMIPPGMTVTSYAWTVNWTCLPLPTFTGPQTVTCTYNLAGTLGHNQPIPEAIYIHYTTKEPGPFTNCATVSVPSTVGVDTNPSNDTACVTVTSTPIGKVVVEKKVKNNTRASAAAINALVFPIDLTCGAPSTLNTSFVLHNGQSHTENNIPYGSLCSVTETTLPPAPPNACPQGLTAIWSIPVITVSPSATIGAPITTFTVFNELNCRDKPTVIDVGITKTGITSPPVTVNFYQFTLTVTNHGAGFSGSGAIVVTDVVPAGMQFNNATGMGWNCGPPPPFPRPAGSTLTCTYIGTGPTTSQVLPAITIDATALGAGPFPPITNCSTVTLTPGSGLVDTNPTNNNDCTTVAKPGQCPPPMVQVYGGECDCPTGTVQNGTQCVPIAPPISCPPPKVPGLVAGQCLCPPGTVLQGSECVKQTTCPPPMVPGPVAGVCICPPGTVQKGRECVRQITCSAPKVPNAAGNECICPQGTVQKGRECVRPTASCISPAKSNGRGGCDCPDGWTKQGSNKCVKRERKGVTGDDVRRGIDIIRGIPGSSGGGRGSNSGGGNSPGKR